MIFYVVPMIVITINDIMAFYVGFYFGKTPLIKLSPKKTLEGYLGGGFLTLIMGTAFSVFCSTFHPTLICPIKVDVAALSWNVLEVRNLFTVTECVRPILFEPQHVQVWHLYQSIAIPITLMLIFQVLSYSMMISPFVIHSFIISLFAAVLGPFGGFFASGFKRACNKKVPEALHELLNPNNKRGANLLLLSRFSILFVYFSVCLSWKEGGLRSQCAYLPLNNDWNQEVHAVSVRRILK